MVVVGSFAGHSGRDRAEVQLDELEELIPSLLVRKFSKALTGVAEPEFDPELVPEAVRSPSAVCPW